jgi:NitT/TauT family transport system permease protein
MKMAKLTRFLPAACVLAAAVLVWHLAVIGSGTRVFPSPGAVAQGMTELWRKGQLIPYALDSLRRVMLGFVLAVVLAVPTGLILASSRTVQGALDPVIQLLRPISPIAWIPISIALFGISDLSTIFLIFLASYFPVALATMNSTRRVPEIYLRVGRNFGMSPAELLRRVVLPAALPEIVAALRIALGIAWMVVVAAEMIAVDSGLGYLIVDARNAGKRYDLVVAGMVLIGAIGLLLDFFGRRLALGRAVRWGRRAEGAQKR